MQKTITQQRVDELAELSKKLRHLIVHNTQLTGGGHFGASLSMVEILTALYWEVMNIDPENPKWAGRDYFVLSKGHACAGFAPVLAEKGFFDPRLLTTFNQLGSCFGMHTTLKMAGVEHPTGSLGHGLSVGLGIALGLKLDGKPNRVFVLIGDGEQQEGSVWEAVMAAGNWGVDNLITIVDRNFLSQDGETEKLMRLEPLADKWRSFNWSVKTVDGHDMGSVLNGLARLPFEPDKPSCLIAETVKGKGVSFMENQPKWHYGIMTDEQYETATREVQFDGARLRSHECLGIEA
ncbi:MAG: transketolase [Kiritimatiellae bacterium]|nr:transketolase [Kiritimatiellia bacterium]